MTVPNVAIPIDFHPSQRPAALADQLQASLQAGFVPGRYLYDSPAQSARWLAYHEAWSPARTEDSVRALYDRTFAATLAEQPTGPVAYVSLGCGGGQKDAQWARLAGARAVSTVLTDTSPALLLTAHDAVSAAGATGIRRIALDLSAWPDRAAYGIDGSVPVVWACLGILPNFEHERLLPYLRRLMAPDDRLVLSANHSPEPYERARSTILPQYDNPFARAWYDGALLELGFALSSTERTLVSAPLEASGDVWRMQYFATPSASVALNLHGRPVRIEPHERIQVFQSTRYTPERLPTLCAEAGLTLCASHVDARREEGVYLLRTDVGRSR